MVQKNRTAASYGKSGPRPLPQGSPAARRRDGRARAKIGPMGAGRVIMPLNPKVNLPFASARRAATVGSVFAHTYPLSP